MLTSHFLRAVIYLVQPCRLRRSWSSRWPRAVRGWLGGRRAPHDGRCRRARSRARSRSSCPPAGARSLRDRRLSGRPRRHGAPRVVSLVRAAAPPGRRGRVRRRSVRRGRRGLGVASARHDVTSSSCSPADVTSSGRSSSSPRGSRRRRRRRPRGHRARRRAARLRAGSRRRRRRPHPQHRPTCTRNRRVIGRTGGRSVWNCSATRTSSTFPPQHGLVDGRGTSIVWSASFGGSRNARRPYSLPGLFGWGSGHPSRTARPAASPRAPAPLPA